MKAKIAGLPRCRRFGIEPRLLAIAPSLVRSEKFESTDSSDGGDVALHDHVLILDTMAWGAPEARQALRAPLVQLHHTDDAHDAVGAAEGR